jgi:hypothetical protein
MMMIKLNPSPAWVYPLTAALKTSGVAMAPFNEQHSFALLTVAHCLNLAPNAMMAIKEGQPTALIAEVLETMGHCSLWLTHDPRWLPLIRLMTVLILSKDANAMQGIRSDVFKTLGQGNIPALPSTANSVAKGVVNDVKPAFEGLFSAKRYL